MKCMIINKKKFSFLRFLNDSFDIKTFFQWYKIVLIIFSIININLKNCFEKITFSNFFKFVFLKNNYHWIKNIYYLFIIIYFLQFNWIKKTFLTHLKIIIFWCFLTIFVKYFFSFTLNVWFEIIRCSIFVFSNKSNYLIKISKFELK